MTQDMEDKTYWGNNGEHQDVADFLSAMIPGKGKIEDPDSPKLEKFRRAVNCYHDFFNNGLGNRAKEFREVFGFGGTKLARQNRLYYEEIETKMSKFILDAGREQKHPRLIAEDQFAGLTGKIGGKKERKVKQVL